MLAAVSLSTVASSLIVAAGALAAVLYAVVKVAERFGWLRTPSAWRTEAEGLSRRVAYLEKELAAVKVENAELRARPDQTTLAAAISRHEERAETRSRATLDALERIATAVAGAAT